MLILRTLGELSVAQAEGQRALPIQRKRLALLALLTAHGRAGLTRDKAMAYLWPESDTESARNSLKQAVFSLRRDLGADLFVSDSPALALNRDVIRSDLDVFTEALAAGSLETALAAYKGPFLDGFHVNGEADFEEWTETQRRRLAAQYHGALEARAAELSRDGREVEAAGVWRALRESDPLSSRGAAGEIRSLLRAGDRASALHQVRRYRHLVDRELGTPPDRAILELERELLAAPVGRPEAAAAVALSANAPAPAPIDPPPARAINRFHAAAAVLLVGLAGLVALAVGHTRSAARASDLRVVAVTPFAFHGSDALSYVSTGLVELITRDLDGAAGIRGIDPRMVLDAQLRDSAAGVDRADALARQVGAAYYVSGDAVEAGGRLRLTAAVHRTGAGAGAMPLATSVAEGTVDDLFGVADRLSAGLLAQWQGGPTRRLSESAAVTTGSLTAFRAYLEGERLFQARDNNGAVAAFQRAVAEDSLFALAYYRLSNAADWAGQNDLARESARRAASFRSRLSPHDQAMVRGRWFWQIGAADSAEKVYRRLTLDYPEDAESWFQLAEVLFHTNATRGRPVAEAQLPFDRALLLQPGSLRVVTHLARLAALAGDTARLAEMQSKWPDAEVGPDVMHAVRRRDHAALERAVAALTTTGAELVYVFAARVAVYERDLPSAEFVMGAALRPERPSTEHVLGLIALAQLRAAQGRFGAADSALHDAESIRPDRALEQRALLALAPFSPVDTAALASLRRSLAQWSRATPRGDIQMLSLEDTLAAGVRIYLGGLLDARLGRADTLAAAARRLDSLLMLEPTHTLYRSMAATLRAFDRRAAGDSRAALAALDSGMVDITIESQQSAFGSRAIERFLRAELLRELGDDHSARPWYASLGEHTPYDLIYMAAAERELAGIARRIGHTTEAAAHLARFRKLWERADIPLRASALSQR